MTEWRDFNVSSFVWMLAAGGLFGAATARAGLRCPWALVSAADVTDRLRRGRAVTALGLGGATMFAYPAALLPQAVLVAGWLSAQVLWIAAHVPVWQRRRPLSRQAVAEGFALGALLTVTGVMWLRDNASVPLLFHGDLASFGLQARDLLAGRYHDFFGDGWAAIPLIAFWTSAISLRVFGDNLAGLNTVPALEGLASLLALYLLARELFGWRAALLTAALAAGDLLLIHYSRAAQYIDPLPFVTWSLYFVVRGLGRGGVWPFATAGLVAGYAVNMYYSGRVILPLIVVALAMTALAAPRAFGARRGGLAALLVGLVLSMGPTLIFDVQHPEVWLARTRGVLLSDPGVWGHTANKYGLAPEDVAGVMVEQLKRSALSFWHCCDAATQFGMARSILDPIRGALLILGLGHAAWNISRQGPALVTVWLAALIAAGTITVDPFFPLEWSAPRFR